MHLTLTKHQALIKRKNKRIKSNSYFGHSCLLIMPSATN